MPVTISVRINNNLSTDVVSVFRVLVSFKENATPYEVLKALQQFQPEYEVWLPFPYGDNLAYKLKEFKQDILDTTGPTTDSSEPPALPSERFSKDFFILEPNKKLISLFAQEATPIEKIRFIELLGTISQVERRPEFSAARESFNFNQHLLQLGIKNPSLAEYASSKALSDKIKRIHLVHKIYLDDSEISAGLHISVSKNTKQDQVIFVSNPETLRLAVSYCSKPVTLIIDGHWEHETKILPHGVWGFTSADEIASHLLSIVRQNMSSIKYIRLLGCCSGQLCEEDKFPPTFNPSKLKFKDELKDDFHLQEMSQFRNRCIYISDGELPFDPNSLAAKICTSLSQFKIPITAHPKISLPYPADVKVSRFNIGTDCENWSGPYFWKPQKPSIYDWWVKLNSVKSITILDQETYDKLKEPHSSWIHKI